MIRLAAATFALVLFAVPLLTAARPVVAVPGAFGLLLAVVGIASLWRWPMTAAACVFVTDYALALWVAGPSVSVVGAAGFGLALLLLLHSAEVARRARHAAVDAGVVRSQLAGWAIFGVATLGTAMLVMALARGVAAAVPFTAAPLLAAAGALGVMLALAVAVTRPSGRTSTIASSRSAARSSG
jgi:hypothetical protein